MDLWNIGGTDKMDLENIGGTDKIDLIIGYRQNGR